MSNPPRGLARWRYRRLETREIGGAAGVITVSDSIADYLAREYAIDRPIVVHNAPVAGRGPMHREIRVDLGLTAEIPLVVFLGGLGPLRGTDRLVRAMAYLDGVHLAFVGGGREDNDAQLKAIAAELGLTPRVHFLPAVAVDQVTRYIASADVGLIPYQSVCLNHDYCMPNKLALHTEAHDQQGFNDEVALLRVDGIPMAGFCAHGGAGSCGYLGLSQTEWAIASNMSYGELLGSTTTLSSQALILADDIPREGPLAMPAKHRGLDLDAARRPLSR